MEFYAPVSLYYIRSTCWVDLDASGLTAFPFSLGNLAAAVAAIPASSDLPARMVPAVQRHRLHSAFAGVKSVAVGFRPPHERDQVHLLSHQHRLIFTRIFIPMFRLQLAIHQRPPISGSQRCQRLLPSDIRLPQGIPQRIGIKSGPLGVLFRSGGSGLPVTQGLLVSALIGMPLLDGFEDLLLKHVSR